MEPKTPEVPFVKAVVVCVLTGILMLAIFLVLVYFVRE